MKTMKKMMTLLAVAGLVLALAPAAQAADVTWQTPTSIYDAGDATVLTDSDGSLVTVAGGHDSAESYGGNKYVPGYEGPFYVNGVTFINVMAADISGFTKDSSGVLNQHQTHDYGGTAIGTDFTSVLDGFVHNEGVSASATITLDGLESGKSYIAQFFIGDEREAVSGDITVGKYVDGNYSITGGANTSAKAFIMPIHSFVGTWVADAATQDFTITNTDSTKTPSVILNAVQWREVTGGNGMLMIVK